MSAPNRETPRPACTGRNQEPAVLVRASERQREKAEQERLCRADALHEYLTMKGEA
jgi:hypothetical protein